MTSPGARRPVNTKRPHCKHVWDQRWCSLWSDECDVAVTRRRSALAGPSCCSPTRPSERRPALFIAPILWLFCSLIHTAYFFTFTSVSPLKLAAHSSSVSDCCPRPRGWSINTGPGIKGQAFPAQDPGQPGRVRARPLHSISLTWKLVWRKWTRRQGAHVTELDRYSSEPSLRLITH